MNEVNKFKGPEGAKDVSINIIFKVNSNEFVYNISSVTWILLWLDYWCKYIKSN